MSKVFSAILMFGLLAGCTKAQGPSNTDYARTSVMVTLPNGRSGGSGVILKSSSSSSTVLTNVHVCSLVQTGGLVKAETGTYPVATYRIYSKSDLCLITVQANLGVEVSLAPSAPPLYSSALVAGHPALLPTAMTTGHFSGRMPIDIMVDQEPCDGTEQGQDILMCAFMGGKPVLRTFDAQFTTALIMPGSSGSGVFNERGELSGLVFAGSGDIGFGFIVPFEYLKDFLSNQDKYPTHVPDAKAKPVNYLKGTTGMMEACRNGTIDEDLANFCATTKFQEIFINE